MDKNTGMQMQFTRGILRLDQMERYIVSVLDFPFLEAFDLLYALRQRLDTENGEAEKRGYRPRWLPTQSLNDFLQFLVPAISHAFVRNSFEPGQRLPHSGQWMSPMPALGIPQFADRPQSEPVPPSLLKQIVVLWLDVVVLEEQAYFSDEERQMQYVQDGIKDIKRSINNADFTWQFIGVDELWKKRREQALGYRALRSLLASQFVTNQIPVTVDGQLLEWRLAREDDGLIPITQAFQSGNGEYYAYTLNLTLRDMPGRDEPLLYMMPRLRRYMSKEVKWTGDDAVRVMIEYSSPLVNQLPLPDHTIQIPVRIQYRRHYRGYIVPMLKRLIGESDTKRAVVDVKSLLKAPIDYIERQNARYHIIYNTGMSPKPNMHPGLPLDHIKAIHHAVTTGLEEWMQAEPPMPVTELVLDENEIKQQELRSLMSVDLIRDAKAFKIWTERQPAKKRLDWLPDIQDRFRLAVKGQPLKILLFADRRNGLDAMEFDVRGVLAVLTRDETLPESITIHRFRTPSELITSIDEITLKAWRDDVVKIKKALQNLHDENQAPVLIDKDSACVALIQRPDSPRENDTDGRKHDDQKKSAIRAAFGSQGIVSQMVRRFPDDDKTGLQVRDKNPNSKKHGPRLLRAVSDMLITSLGMTYGSPAAYYVHQLGFDPAFAEQIVVEYWVRYRQTKPPKADFIAVVRQYANGYLEIVLPDPETGQPQPRCSVYEASHHLQLLFSRGRLKDRVYARYSDVPDERVLTFFQSQLKSREEPTLIVPQVGDWRSRNTAWFHDDAIIYGQVKFDSHTWDADDLKNVRIVKMLADEQHNMRYWSDRDDTEGLLTVHDNLAQFPTIYSIDARKEDAKKDIGGNIQRSRVIEFSALLMQPEDDELRQAAWCQIPHLSRLHPGWGKNAIVHTYPIHVIHHLINDALWAVFEKGRS